MSDPFSHKPFPRWVLIAAGSLFSFAILAAAWGRVMGTDATALREDPGVTSRQLIFADRTDGGIDVVDAETETLVTVLAPGSNGFLRATLRSLARERRMTAAGPETPFALTLRTDGRLVLEDPATGAALDLGAFGVTNAQAFASLLDHGGTVQ